MIDWYKQELSATAKLGLWMVLSLLAFGLVALVVAGAWPVAIVMLILLWFVVGFTLFLAT